MTKYIAKLNNEIIGKRTTQNRTYTHAIVVQDVEEAARASAYGYTSTSTDSSNFEFSSYIAAQQPGVTCRPRGWRLDTTFSEKEIASATGEIEGGFDAYVRRLRERAIARFEDCKAKGGFKPYVAAWSGSLALAQKAAAQHTSATRMLVAIVEAEVAPSNARTAKALFLNQADERLHRIAQADAEQVEVD